MDKPTYEELERRVAVLSKLIWQLLEPQIEIIMEVDPYHPVLERFREVLKRR